MNHSISPVNQLKAIIFAGYLSLGWSWPLSVHSGIPFIAIFGGLVSFAFVIALLENYRTDIKLIGVVSIILGVIAIMSVLTQGSLLFNRTSILPLSLLAFVFLVNKRNIHYICSALTIFTVVALVCSWISFFYTLLGGEHFGVIKNPDGRGNALYLLSYSNSVFGKIIRPSFVYDEPGAFSFFICFVVILRELLSRDNKTSLVIMFFGVITFSLTHVLLFFLYSFYLNRTYSLLMLCLVLVLISLFVQYLGLFDFFLERFVVEDGKLSGDNRSREIDYYLNSITPRIFIFGNVECYKGGVDLCADGPITATPLAPNYRQGLIGVFYQTIILVLPFFSVLLKKRFHLIWLMFFLLLIQRPYYSGFGYSLMVITMVYCFLVTFKERDLVSFSDVKLRRF